MWFFTHHTFFCFSSGQPWRAVPGVAVAHSDIIICVFVTISVDFHTFFNKIWKLGRELGNGGVYASTADQTQVGIMLSGVNVEKMLNLSVYD